MTTLGMPWSAIEVEDDELDSEFAEKGLYQIVGDTKRACVYEGNYKITTVTQLIDRVERKSLYSSKRKAEMIKNAQNDNEEYTNEVDKEVHFEVPHSLRRVDEEFDDRTDRQRGGGLQSLMKDTVRSKFDQLTQLDSEKFVMASFTAQEEDPIPLPTFSSQGRQGRPQKEDSIIRVTNLSEEVADEDLSNLFGQFGKIERIYIARDKETRKSRGYAFITYSDAAHAEEAIKRLDRHGHDSLILRVEWAKPSARYREDRV